MLKIPQSNSELQAHLEEQLQFLAASAEAYDNGFEGEGKRLATNLRVLLHDTASSISLLGQIGLKIRNFYDSAANSNAILGTGKRVASYTPLAGISAGKDGKYVPYLDEVPPGYADFVPFNDFWNRVIFIDNANNSFTRRDIVLAVANKDGGAHIDPNLDEDYYNLSRKNAMGWEVTSNGTTALPAGKAELAALRQIAHEVLRTLKPKYPYKRMLHGGLNIIAPAIVMTMNFTEPKEEKIEINDPCPCASGMSYGDCHKLS